MTVFRTTVTELPATPLGLLAPRWIIEHCCTICHDQVAAEDLLVHAQRHERARFHPHGGAID